MSYSEENSNAPKYIMCYYINEKYKKKPESSCLSVAMGIEWKGVIEL
jgi:hypothetical protein